MILDGKYEQRSRPRTAIIKCKVETGKTKKPKELEEMRQQGERNGCPSEFHVYVHSEALNQSQAGRYAKKAKNDLKNVLGKKRIQTAYQRRKSV